MSNNWAQVPGYWVKNIDKFKNKFQLNQKLKSNQIYLH